MLLQLIVMSTAHVSRLFHPSIKLFDLLFSVVFLLIAAQSHYDSELDVLDEYLARVERSIIVSDSRSGGGGGSNAFESHLERTTAALSNSLSQVLVSVPHVRMLFLAAMHCRV